jgi:hypothetical protein
VEQARAADRGNAGDRRMSEWEEFIKTAGQYYVAGRYSAFAGFIPTTGNLFHHAIEMFLKGGLSKTGITLADLKKLSHDLPKIWETFKRTFKDQSLDRFDHVIASLHRFEDIRYPDLIVQKGMNAKIEILAPARPPGPQSGSEPVYELSAHRRVSRSDIQNCKCQSSRFPKQSISQARGKAVSNGTEHR